MVQTVLEKMLERVGRSKVPRFAREDFGFRAVVMKTNEFRRIQNIPRRVWDTEPWVSNIIDILTDELKTESGTMKLWKEQAAALNDIALQDGAFLPIAVGRGKALISLLAPIVAKSDRPLLFVPAQLREQTNAVVVPEMRKHWNIRNDLKVVSYSALSLEKNQNMLEEYRPDLIILDECHRVKNKRAGRTRRMIRYFKNNPETKCVAMSGTISNRSIKDFAHILEWCLKRNAPVPSGWMELSEWADAIDEKVPDDARVAPGALSEFCNPEETVRQGFRRRMTETPGVVASDENVLGNSLLVSRYEFKKQIPNCVFEHLENLRNTWTTPNGDLIAEKLDLWRHAREIALGFWYEWDPPAPRDWINARREWKRYVRETLRHNQRRLDTELQVWNDCKRMSEPPDLWRAWANIKDIFKPNPVAVWFNAFALDECVEWMKDGGIVWTEHREFGKRLSERSGKKYFGAGDDSILRTDDAVIIASVAAHSEGKNLQRYSRNLVVAPMPTGKRWEQLLGRTHREGQQSDEVFCDVFLHADELASAFEQARADARFLEDTIGNVQKLNYCNVVI